MRSVAVLGEDHLHGVERARPEVSEDHAEGAEREHHLARVGDDVALVVSDFGLHPWLYRYRLRPDLPVTELVSRFVERTSRANGPLIVRGPPRLMPRFVEALVSRIGFHGEAGLCSSVVGEKLRTQSEHPQIRDQRLDLVLHLGV